MVEVEGYLLCLFDAARHDPVADLMILEVGLVCEDSQSAITQIAYWAKVADVQDTLHLYSTEYTSQRGDSNA